MYPFLKNPFFIILSFVIGKFMSLFFWSSKMSYLIRILLLDRSPSLSDCHLSQLNSSLVYFQSQMYSYIQFRHDCFASWLFLFMFFMLLLFLIYRFSILMIFMVEFSAVMRFIFPNGIISDILYIVFST